MCGIAGFTGNFSETLLIQMGSTIAHRGPNDSGTWYDSDHCVGLAHRRLSIQDLSSSGHQPMVDPNGTAVIVFNGEIYNYHELHDKYLSDVPMQGHSDTEVLLQLYCRFGMEMLDKLNGIFSFAIWDLKEHKLHCARDPFGVKPFYYAQTGAGFLFASEIKALTQYDKLDLSIDPHAVLAHLTYLWAPAPMTMLNSIRKLEQGERLTVDEKGKIIDRVKYYKPEWHQSGVNASIPDLISETRSRLCEAVRRQLISDVPVGAFLSGGLDSSAIVRCTIDAGAPPPNCFTIRYKGKDVEREGFADDYPYAVSIAKILGVPLDVIDVDSSLIDDLDLMLYHLDEPQADPAALNLYRICRLAHDKGIKVLLSGAGGDDVFSGYRRHLALMQERLWSTIPTLGRHAIAEISRHFPQNIPIFRRIAKAFAYADRPADERIAGYFHWIEQTKAIGLLSEELQVSVAEDPFSAPLMHSMELVPSFVEPLQRMLFLERRHFLCDHNLNYTDKMSMASGIEVRVPFLDPDLVSFASALPSKLLQKGREGKWILKKAMEGFLPNETIYRPKTGFGVPLRSWIKNELHDAMSDALGRESVLSRGLFDPDAVERLIKADRSGQIDAAYVIFSLLCIERWCRIFIDKKVS